MRISFEKWHGLGNDFVIVDARSKTHADIDAAMAARLADRRRGIGCDQVLVIQERDSDSGATARVEIRNADGTTAQQCGNGMRCVAAYLARGCILPARIEIVTAGGLVRAQVTDQDQVEVDLGEPNLEPASLPFATPESGSRQQLELSKQVVNFNVVSMGNPHAVLRVADVGVAEVDAVGQELGQHPRFAEGVNVGFMQVQARDVIALRVYERGAGETMACGSGASAAVVAGIHEGWLEGPVTVSLPGGKLVIHWPGPGSGVAMTGPATFVYAGEIDL